MRLTAPLLVLLSVSAPAALADGLALGALEVRSALGQPFDATLSVDAGTAATLDGLSVRIAAPAAYSAHDLNRPPALDTLRFTVTVRDGSRTSIAITSTAPIREPTLSLLVEAATAGATVQREYTVLLDPPGRSPAGKIARPDTVISVPAAAAPTTPAAPVGASFDYELDAYYSNVSVEIPLTDEPVPEGGTLSEWEVYRKLFLDSFHPRVLLFEASVYPMPVLGTYIKDHSPDTYDSFTVGNTGINVLETLTAGFQEPWAVSAFIGSEIDFTRDDQKRAGTNKGYMGYLVSYGAKHIKDNVLIDDPWWEFEWKLKGERERADEHLVWSFRTGLKNHSNQDISDILYVGARRSNLDFKAKFLSFLENSSFDASLELTQDHLEFARMDFVIGKKYPFKDKGFALALDIGVIYEKNIKYLGVLQDLQSDNVTLVIRPNIEF